MGVLIFHEQMYTLCYFATLLLCYFVLCYLPRRNTCFVLKRVEQWFQIFKVSISSLNTRRYGYLQIFILVECRTKAISPPTGARGNGSADCQTGALSIVKRSVLFLAVVLLRR